MKRVAIVGTAASWRDCPFLDPGLDVWGLNDAWTLGFPRVTAWFELHPLDRLYFRPVEVRQVYADAVPHGYYVRPQGHLERLQDMARTIPVWLQSEPPPGWPPNARRLPLEDLERTFGTWWASGPAFEVGLAILQGYEEIQVYGIHLETEHEYREQRENFARMLGFAEGRGIRVIMAERSPLMKHPWKYGYERKPFPHPAKVALQLARHQQAEVASALVRVPWWQRRGPMQDRLRRLRAVEADAVEGLQYRSLEVLTVPPLELGGA